MSSITNSNSSPSNAYIDTYNGSVANGSTYCRSEPNSNTNVWYYRYLSSKWSYTYVACRANLSTTFSNSFTTCSGHSNGIYQSITCTNGYGNCGTGNTTSTYSNTST